jgi:antitoxin (DNA-binding transcriptional repressor) of toxin-antitoxin stability system
MSLSYFQTIEATFGRHASWLCLVRRVEAGEEIAITVAGRPAAKLVPAAPRTWRRWNDISELFAGSDYPTWTADRDEITRPGDQGGFGGVDECGVDAVQRGSEHVTHGGAQNGPR